jgi:hypothetical protein
MDVAEPPRVVVESTASCRNGSRVHDALVRDVESALAPGEGWVVRVRIRPVDRRTLGAEGEITDTGGGVVASRRLSGRDCDALSRAVGIWATLVLDAEVAKSREAASAPVPAASGPAPTPGPVPVSDASPTVVPPGVDDAEFPLLQPDERSRRGSSVPSELGLGTFLMAGAGPGSLAGVTLHGVTQPGDDAFVRPSLSAGTSLASGSTPTGAVNPGVLWIAGRLDVCLRASGLYPKMRGLQIDACGGAEAGLVHLQDGGPVAVRAPDGSTDFPHVSFGPALGLRGELGGRVSVELRGVGGVNLVRPTLVDPLAGAVDGPAFTGRAELAFSWSLL